MIQYLVTNNNNTPINSESTTPPPNNYCIVGGSTYLKFPIYYEGDNIIEKTFGIAIGPMSGKVENIKLPEDLQVLVFLNEFNQEIPEGFIGPRVTTLHFFDISIPLESISIPSTVKNIYFENGFNQTINSNHLPESIKEIHLFNINSNVLTKESFSKYNKEDNKLNLIYLEDGFNLVLEPGSLPMSNTIRINSIGKPLLKGSIAEGTEYVIFENYNHEIVTGVVPQSTVQLVFNNIGVPLVQGSIPNSCSIEVIFESNYKQPLNQKVIPELIESLTFNCYDFPPLQLNSIPSNVKTLYCCKQLRKDQQYFKNIENYRDLIKKKSIF